MARFKTTVIPDRSDPSKPLLTPAGNPIKRPLLKVELLDAAGDSLFDTQALVDSGADVTMINAQYALALGIDLSAVKEIDAFGIYNDPIKAKPAEVDIRISALNATVRTRSLFVYTEKIDVLIGREDFFEKFVIRFKLSEDYFEVKPIE